MEISRVKFHVLLTYNYDDKDAKRLLRMHKSILCGATQINLKVHISDVHNMHLPRYLKTFMKGLHLGSGAIQGQDTSISRKVTIISFFKGQAHSLFLALKKMQLEIGTCLERRREFKSAFNLNIVAISEMARGCLAQIG